MADVVVTDAGATIKAVFNDAAPYSGITQGYWTKAQITSVRVLNEGGVEVLVENDRDWLMSYNGSVGLKVDTIAGVAPTDDDDLCDKIEALL